MHLDKERGVPSNPSLMPPLNTAFPSETNLKFRRRRRILFFALCRVRLPSGNARTAGGKHEANVDDRRRR